MRAGSPLTSPLLTLPSELNTDLGSIWWTQSFRIHLSEIMVQVSLFQLYQIHSRVNPQSSAPKTRRKETLRHCYITGRLSQFKMMVKYGNYWMTGSSVTDLSVLWLEAFWAEATWPKQLRSYRHRSPCCVITDPPTPPLYQSRCWFCCNTVRVNKQPRGEKPQCVYNPQWRCLQSKVQTTVTVATETERNQGLG